MTREQLIKAIVDNQERWSCPDICKSIEIGCMECAEKQLAEYEEGIRAELYDEVRDEVEQSLSSVLDDEKRISKAEALKPIAKILDDFVCRRIERPADALARINKCIYEQTKEQNND